MQTSYSQASASAGDRPWLVSPRHPQQMIGAAMARLISALAPLAYA
jgi:hypothetical protein